MKFVELQKISVSSTGTVQSRTVLPNFTDLTFDVMWSVAPSTITFGYPLNEANALGLKAGSIVSPLPDGEDREFWFILESTSGVLVTDSGFVRSFSGRSFSAILEDDVVLSSAWPNPVPADHSFQDATPGTVVRTLLARSHERGFLTLLQPEGFTGSVDSNGDGWPFIRDYSFSAGSSVLQAIQELEDGGDAEFTFRSGALRAYKPESTQRHLAPSVVTFRGGQSLQEHTQDSDASVVATDVVVIGEEGASVHVYDVPARNALGRRRTRFVTHSGISDIPTLGILAQAELDGVKHIPVEENISVPHQDPSMAQPFKNFRPGDWVWLENDSGELTEIQIQQISVSVGADGVTVGVALGSLLSSALEKLKRRIDAIIGGNGSRRGPVPVPPRNRLAPAAPSLPGVSTEAYTLDNGFIRAQVVVSWPPVTTNVDGTPTDDVSYYEVYFRPHEEPPLPWQLLGKSEGEPVYYSDLPPKVAYQFQVFAYDVDGLKSPGSPIRSIFTASDDTPPPIPSAPVLTTRLGVISVFWDGLGFLGQEMPLDFDHIEISMTTATKPEPANSDVISRIFEGSGTEYVTDQPHGELRFFRFRAVDRSRNKSVWSEEREIATKALVDEEEIEQDIIDQIEESRVRIIEIFELVPPDIRDVLGELEDNWTDADDRIRYLTEDYIPGQVVQVTDYVDDQIVAVRGEITDSAALLDAKLVTAQQEIDAAEIRLEGAETRLTGAEAAITDASGWISETGAELGTNLAQAQQDIDAAEVRLEGAETRLTTAEGEIASASAWIDVTGAELGTNLAAAQDKLNAAFPSGVFDVDAAIDAAMATAGGSVVTYTNTTGPGSPPGAAGRKNGDVHRNRNATTGEIYAEWMLVAGVWKPVNFGDSILRSLDVGKITGGSAAFVDFVSQNLTSNEAVINELWTEVVRSQKITTDMLIVGSGENMIPWNPAGGLEPHEAMGTATAETTVDADLGHVVQIDVPDDRTNSWGIAFRFRPDTPSRTGLSYDFDIVGGESFRFRVGVGRGGSYLREQLKRWQVYYYSGDGAHLSTASSPNTIAGPYGADPEYLEWTTTAPDNAAFMRVYLQANNPGLIFLHDASIKRAADASLIVDGAVTAKKITITGDENNPDEAGLVANIASIMNLDVKNLVSTNATIDEGVVNQLWADVVRAKKITTDMLLVGPGENLLTDPNLLDADLVAYRVAQSVGTWHRTSRDGGVDRFMRYTPAPGETATLYYPAAPGQLRIPVSPEGVYRFKFNWRSNASVQVRPAISYALANGTTAWTSPDQTSWTDWESTGFSTTDHYTWTAPIGAESAMFGIQVRNATGSWVDVGPTSVMVSGASLIVDGSINAKHINVTGELTAQIASILHLDVENLTATGTSTLETAVVNNLWTNVVRANKITTDMLLVGSGTNYLVDPHFLDETVKQDRAARSTMLGSWGYNSGDTTWYFGGAQSGTNTKTFVFSSGAMGTSWTNAAMEVIPGEQLKFRYQINVTGQVRPVYYVVNQDGSTGVYALSGAVFTTYPAGIRWEEHIVTVPANAAKLLPALQFSGTTTTAFVRGGASFTRLTDASLIVDGTIVADKIATNAIEAKHISADAVVANHIKAGAIDADHIAANAITARALAVQPMNAFPDPYFADGPGWAYAADIRVSKDAAAPGGNVFVFQTTSATGVNSYYNGPAYRGVQLEPGATYRLRFTGCRGGSAPHHTQLRFWIRGTNAAGSTITHSVNLNSTPTSFSFGEYVEYDIAVPTTFQGGMTVGFMRVGGPYTSSNYQIADVSLLRKNGGTLIEDGAITTDKIFANAITAGKIAADAIEANHIKAAAINATHIKTGSIYADALAIGHQANLLPGADEVGNTNKTPAELGWSGFGRNANDPSFWLQGRKTNRTDAPFFLKAGTKYKVSVDVKASVNSTRFYMQFVAQSGQNLGGTYIFSNQLVGFANTWYSFETEFTTPESGLVLLNVYANHQNGADNESGYQWFRNMSVTSMTPGVLIEDGAITGDKIVANAITAREISTLSIETGHLKANVITAAKIDAGAIEAIHIKANAIEADKIKAGAIDGKVITGATLRTKTSPQVGGGQWTSATFRMWDTSGNMRVNFYPAANTFTINGTFTASSSNGHGIEVRPPSGGIGGWLNFTDPTMTNEAYIATGGSSSAATERGTLTMVSAATVTNSRRGRLRLEPGGGVVLGSASTGTGTSDRQVLNMQPNTHIQFFNVDPNVGIQMGTEGVTGTQMQANGTTQFWVRGDRITANGIWTNTSTGTANVAIYSNNSGELRRVTSLRAFKDDIQPLSDSAGLAFLDLEPVTWLDKGEVARGEAKYRHMGFIAEQVAELEDRYGVEGLTVRDENGALTSVAYDRLLGLAVSAVRELDKRVKELENK